MVGHFVRVVEIKFTTKDTRMENCTLDCILIQGNLNQTQMCMYTQEQCHQDTIQFVQTYYCFFHASFIILIFLGVLLL